MLASCGSFGRTTISLTAAALRHAHGTVGVIVLTYADDVGNRVLLRRQDFSDVNVDRSSGKEKFLGEMLLPSCPFRNPFVCAPTRDGHRIGKPSLLERVRAARNPPAAVEDREWPVMTRQTPGSCGRRVVPADLGQHDREYTTAFTWQRLDALDVAQRQELAALALLTATATRVGVRLARVGKSRTASTLNVIRYDGGQSQDQRQVKPSGPALTIPRPAIPLPLHGAQQSLSRMG